MRQVTVAVSKPCHAPLCRSSTFGEVLCAGPVERLVPAPGDSGEDCQPDLDCRRIGGVGRLLAYPVATAATAGADDEPRSAARAAGAALCRAEFAAAAGPCHASRPPPLRASQGHAPRGHAPRRASSCGPPRDPPPGLRVDGAAAVFGRAVSDVGPDAAAAVGQPPARPEDEPAVSEPARDKNKGASAPLFAFAAPTPGASDTAPRSRSRRSARRLR